MSDSKVDKNNIDVSQVFQTYIALAGDAGKTAVALHIDRATVEALAKEENWVIKAKEWNELRTGEGADIKINRTLNYVQGQRLRSILDRLITRLFNLPREELATLLTRTSRGGKEFSARPLTDLVKAAEACQLMIQRALGDTAAERPADERRGQLGSNLALKVMEAMNAADKAGLDSVGIVREEFKPAQAASQ